MTTQAPTPALAALADREGCESFRIVRVLQSGLLTISKHGSQDEAETAMLALGERYPCGGERHLILVEAVTGSSEQ